MKKIVLVGKGASGKNYLMERFEKRGFKHLVSHTTRIPRLGEKEGREYHFVSLEEFKKMISNNEFIEYQEFNGNFYGSSVEEWNNSDIIIMAAEGVENLNKIGKRNECFVIYIDIPYHIRKDRFINARKMNDEEIVHRLYSDDKEFENFTDFDLRITNDDF